jgi:hypothetical protein
VRRHKEMEDAHDLYDDLEQEHHELANEQRELASQPGRDVASSKAKRQARAYKTQVSIGR